MKKLNIKSLSLMMMSTALFTGCAATKQAEERHTETESLTTKKFDSSAVNSATSSIDDSASKSNNFGKTQRNWISPLPLPRVEAKVVLPEMFQKQVSMTMPGTVNAVEVLSEMQRSTGINFQLNSDIHDTSNGIGTIIGGAGSDSKSDGKPLLISDFVFRGTLEDALNLLGSKVNLSWKWNGREIEIYRFETKTYNIAALAGSTSTSSNVDLKGDTSGKVGSEGASGTPANAGSAGSNVSRSATLTTWNEIRAFLVSQLSPSGTIAILESTGAVTIKDVPVVHKRLVKSIGDLNEMLTKQIFLSVNIYAVSVENSDNAGIDWNLVWGKTTNEQNSIGYNSTSGSTGNSFSIGVLKGPFTGTNVVVKALSTLGKTSVVNQFQVTTLNGQPTPIAANTKTGYLSEIKVILDDTGKPSAYELKAGEVSAGINLNITPKIEPNGNVLIEYVMNLSNLTGVRTFTAPNGSAIEIPTSDLKSVLQRASLRSGQTLVLSGFKQQSSAGQQSGMGAPTNMLLGGSHEVGVKDQYMVITVTPYLANSNNYLTK